MSKKAMWAEVLIFLLFIFGFFIANLVSPDRVKSEQENRYLQTLPEFTFERLFDKTFTKEFEDYTTDQFVLRDEWITLKAASELAVGKESNNGVSYGKGQTLIEPFTKPEKSDLDANVGYLNQLVENTDADVYFALLPEKSEIWADRLPARTPNDSEAEVIEYCYGLSNAHNVDVLSAMREHADEYIYYRTDHHWTSLGAYYGFTAIGGAMGLDVPALESYDARRVVSDSFYGTTWSKSGFSWVEPDSMEVFVDAPEGLEITSYPEGLPVEGKLYDESWLGQKDKYSMFMGGNCPLHEIVTGNEGPSLLILRDSYMDSLIPFLLDGFSEIHVLDLRYYRMSISDYIAEHDFDNVLVAYSIDTFTNDSSNLFLMAG